jgi:fatty-acyl-CoA synthase
MSETLLHALETAARSSAGIVLLEDDAASLSYHDLLRLASRTAPALARRQALHQPIFFVLPSSVAFFRVFWGTLWAGRVPAPLPQPKPFSDLEEYAQRLSRCAAQVGGAPIIAFASLIEALHETETGKTLDLVAVESLHEEAPCEPEEGPLGLVQFTSGSLGAPKGVMLSHRAILGDVRAFWERHEGRVGDTFVSWLPLVHDLGLIGVHLQYLAHQSHQVIIPTERFLWEPDCWVKAMHDFRADATMAPPFGYSMACHHSAAQGRDLSSLRAAGCGGEPVDPRILRKFTQHFAPANMNPNVVACGYGMAEHCVVAVMGFPGKSFRSISVEPGLHMGERARRCEEGKGIALSTQGRPLRGVEMKIARSDGSEAPTGEIGEIWLKSDMLFSGYWGDTTATEAAFSEGWYRTGDLGFLDESELFVAGRLKDMIIVQGRNYFPEEIEAVVGDTPGARPGCTAAFGHMDPAGGREKVTLVIESTLTSSSRDDFERSLRRRVADNIGCPIDRVLFVEPRTLPRTPSGKLQRSQARLRWETL